MHSITQELVGRLANNKKDFKISLGKFVWHTNYDWAYCDLREQRIVGFITSLGGRPILTLVNICEVAMCTIHPSEVGWVIGVPLLHSTDTRDIKDLAIGRFTLHPKDIAFVLEKET